MLTIHDEPDCGNAPRREILRELTLALAKRDSEYITSMIADVIVWALIGERVLHGNTEVQAWAATLPEVEELTFGSLITHGREASVDGVLGLADGTDLAFCHVLRFTGATKSAKIRAVNSYLIAR